MIRQSLPIAQQLPPPPQICIRHPELTARGAEMRLFNGVEDPPAEGPWTNEQVLLLFKRMHCCSYRMHMMWRNRKPRNGQMKERYLAYHERYLGIREALVEANVGLVYNLLRKTSYKHVDQDELLGEGLMALMRTVEGFDPWRGWQFSTYACRAIIYAFTRVARKHKVQPQACTIEDVDHQEQCAEWSERQRNDHHELLLERLSRIVKDADPGLTARERFVISRRFPLRAGAQSDTLDKLSNKMRLSKERVRQIQAAALGKLRRALVMDPLLQ